MFERKIIFSAAKEFVNQKIAHPEPIKLNIPPWFKELKHSLGNETVKGCIPFLDTLTSGYLIRMPQDMAIAHNVTNDKGDKDSFVDWGMASLGAWIGAKGLNLNHNTSEIHGTNQLGKCPYVEQNKNLPFYKIMNPWMIQTPPGYSCLFLPPLNNVDDRFQIIPGIVDTDKYDLHINFPIVLNGDKYDVLKTTIKVNTPVAQVFPFKRENWKMEIQNRKEKHRWSFFKLQQRLLHKYKNAFWQKKSWK